jgi:fatty acid desaturase
MCLQVCSNPFSEWLWGGMQYQLEHHLFPTMPRYKCAPAMQPYALSTPVRRHCRG